jgi:CrcB protein
MTKLLLVGAGGALGAVLRYLISLIPVKGAFPTATLVTNVLGAAAIGFVVGLTLGENSLDPRGVLFLKTGVCGGFTTFSTFSLETMNLLEGGKVGLGLIYGGLSLCLSVAGVWFGRWLALKLFGA